MIDTSREAVAQLVRWAESMSRSAAAGAASTDSVWSKVAATLRALVAERDAADRLLAQAEDIMERTVEGGPAMGWAYHAAHSWLRARRGESDAAPASSGEGRAKPDAPG